MLDSPWINQTMSTTASLTRFATTLRPYKHFLRVSSAFPYFVSNRPRTALRTQNDEPSISADPLWDSAKPFEEIPGPEPLPVIGNFWRFLPKIGDLGEAGSLGLYETLNEKYGPICALRALPGKADVVFVYEPDAIEKFFRNEGLWPNRSGLDSLRAYRKRRPDLFDGAQGLASTNGKEWADFRHAVNQTMMQPRNAKQYVAPIDRVSQEFIERIRFIRDKNMEMPDDFANEMSKWALESITLIALDTRLGCLANDLPKGSETLKMIESVQTFFNCLYLLDVRPSVWKYVSTPTWRRLCRVLDYFHDIVLKRIEHSMDRLKALPPETVGQRDLSVLETLLLKNDNPKIAVTMAIDMMTAGIDTTSNVNATTLLYLAKNPEKQEKLREEVDKVLETRDTPITASKLEHLKYLRACIKECMRIEPIVVGNARTLPKDLVLMGYQIPKGVQIVGVHSVLCQKEEYFERPLEFIPERWLPDAEYQHLRAKHPFAYLPFGFGPRMCIGRRFAQIEMETLLAKIIRNFKVEWHHPDPKSEMWLLRTMVSPLKFTMIDRND